MSTVAPTISAPPAFGMPPLHRISVDEFDRIIASGALEDPGRIELIDGYMVEKMAKNAGHGYATKQTMKALDNRLPAGWTSRKEEPVRIPEFNEPEPDITIVRGSDTDFRYRIPIAADVALIVETSESSLSQDRGKKQVVYAGARIPIYWIINLVDRQVEVYTDPGPGGYQSRSEFKPGQQIPVVIAGQALAPIAVDDILP